MTGKIVKKKNKKRKNIALFMAMLENEFSAAILEGASMGAEEVDANLIVFPVGLIDGAYSDKVGNVFRYQYNVLNAFLKSESIDAAVVEYGTIVSSIPDKRKQEFLSLIGDIPVILLSEDAEGYPSICVDNKNGLAEVICHLIDDHGCSRIGFVSGPENNHDAQERLQVYKDVLTGRGIYGGDDWISYGNFSVYSEQAVSELLERHPDIEAIVFANDHMALGSYELLKKMGREPGRDIYITGFDNIPSAVLAEPPLTTVMADIKQLSYKAVLELDKDEPLPNHMFIKTHIAKRSSCGCNNNIKASEMEDALGDSYIIENTTREKILEGEKRKEFEVELGNILREMVFYQDSRAEWYSSVLDVLKKLDFGSGYIFQYDDCIYHRNRTPWNMPQTANLMGYYTCDEKQFYEMGDFVVDVEDIFNHEMLQKENRYAMGVTPLFFRENQYGFMLVESNPKYFQYAFQIASQISSTLEIMRILEKQDMTNAKLTFASRSKSQFLTNMSRELRTPINAILGMNEMILRENEIPEIDDYAAEVKSAANTLLSIANDINDFSKLEENKMTIVREEYDLLSILKDAVNKIMPKAEIKNLCIHLDCEKDIPSRYLGDGKRISQVLDNLLSNAVKYTNTGGAELCVRGKRDGEKEILTFTVRDTGIGISEENITKLLDKSKPDRTSNSEGIGLGLGIITGILSLMGSELKVESCEGKGSEFSFELWQSVADDKPIEAIEQLEGNNTKEKYQQLYTAPTASILLADDNGLNRAIIKNLLKYSKINIDEADSGNACIDLFEKNHYDLVLLDDVMPDLSGAETLQLLKQLPEFERKPVPVVLVSSNVGSTVANDSYATAFDGILTKPIDPQVLDDMVIEHISESKILFNGDYQGSQEKRRSGRRKLLKTSEEVSANKKECIVIVDDNPVTLHVAQKMFGSICEIICFNSGIKCLNYINSTDKYPDLIVADVSLKDVNGFSLMAQIQGNPDTAEIPVVLSAYDNNRDIEVKCFEEGAADFFIKPFVPEIVKRRVRKLLDLSHLQKHLEDEVAQQTKASEDGRRKVERLTLQSMTAMAAAIDAKDNYTNGHSVRVAKYSHMIAMRVGKNERETNDIYFIGLLHDVGKIGVPDDIINKPSKLTDDEFAVIKSHPVIGADILKKIDEIPNIAIGARWHHERFDGRGYPDGLKGEAIPEIARIIGVADAYDAMTSIRSYRGIMSQEKVRDEIEKGRGSQFDPLFADIMLQIIDEDKEYTLHE